MLKKENLKMKNSVTNVVIDGSQDAAPVAILYPKGILDFPILSGLIESAKGVYESGQRFLIIDMEGIGDIGIAGLFALYSIAMIFRGEEPLSPEGGLTALRSMAHHVDGVSPNLKLFKPQPYIQRMLASSGLPIYDDWAKALASFSRGKN